MTIEEQQKTEATINRNSKITLGLVMLLLTGAVGFTWNIGEKVADIQSTALANNQELKDLIRDGDESGKDIEREVVGNRSRIDAILATRWSIDNEAEDAARNAIANPGIRYADPKNPGDYFYVRPNTP